MLHAQPVVIDLSAEETALINLGDSKAVKVPKRFTIESKVNDNPVNILMSFPVKDVQGRNYDALSLLCHCQKAQMGPFPSRRNANFNSKCL